MADRIAEHYFQLSLEPIGEEVDRKQQQARQQQTAAPSEPDPRKRRSVVRHDTESKRVTKPARRKSSASTPRRKSSVNASSSRPRKSVSRSMPLSYPPTERLDVFVFGSNSQAELGLGKDVDSKAVPRPRLNHGLSADTVGVVQLATGGQHCVALTHDNKILTWGANDLFALGRDTSWSGETVESNTKDDSSDSNEGGELNPRETTPTPVEAAFPYSTVFTQVAASDNASFALTSDGLVYGWGTFRGTEGNSTYTRTTEVQKTPAQIPLLARITKIATGINHVLGLTNKGEFFAWGECDQYQLGRKIITRHKLNSLAPNHVKLPKNIVDIGAGSYHSFAITTGGVVYGWGMNNFGQTGHAQGLGEADTSVLVPAPIEGIKGYGPIISVTGGEHHSIAVTASHECLVWGRLDGSQSGLVVKDLPDTAVVLDEYGKRRILKAAHPLPGLKVAAVAAGIDCCMAITTTGEAYGWGFCESYRTGLATDDDVVLPKRMDSRSVKDRTLTWAGLGGQFGIVTSVHQEIAQ